MVLLNLWKEGALPTVRESAARAVRVVVMFGFYFDFSQPHCVF